jgi:hypothetical protein
MKKSRLIELFSSFTRKEQRELGKFVQSPVFNQREDVKLLYNYLYQNFPFKRDSSIEKSFVYSSIFPKCAYNDKEMDYAMSFLFGVMKSFLVHQELYSQPQHAQVYLNRALQKKKVTRIFEKEIKNTEKDLRKQPYRNADYHYFSYKLNFEKYVFNQSVSRGGEMNFQTLSDEFTNYFLANKLWLSCAALAHKRMSKIEFREDFLPEILHHIEQNDYADVPAVNVYYHCYKSLTSEDTSHYFGELTSLMDIHYAEFSSAELKDIYVAAINYCIGQFNKGKSDFIKTAFELYKNGLQKEVFTENGYFSRFTYHNIVLSGLVLKEFDWVHNFIYEYKPRIEKKHRESSFHYNLALYYFRKPDYDQAMDLLQKVEFSDVHWNMNSRRMLLKIYFEKGELESLESLLVSFKNFIYRHKELGGYYRDNNLNLLKFVSRLLSLGQFEKDARAALKKEIEATKGVADKDWLLEQI